MITTPQIRLVQQTFAQLEPRSFAIAELFYSRLFELAPEVRPLFFQNSGSQGEKLMHMLGLAVRSLDSIGALVPVLKALGARHRGYGVLDSHYGTVGEALLWTLEQMLGDSFDDDARAAWAATYALLAETMKSGGVRHAA